MRKICAATLVALTLTGCSSNGWTAEPVEENEECYAIERWESDGWTRTTTSEGVACLQEVVPDGR